MRPEEEAGATPFEAARPRLLRVAYRMLGSFAEAEDVVQEAWIRWQGTDRRAVREPEAFLLRTVTRLCLDALGTARARRERYLGAWLPEPLVEPLVPEEAVAEDVTLTLMLALERLTPLERAAFLLHDIFDLPFGEVAAAIGRDPAACRQLAARARANVRRDRPRFTVSPQQGHALVDAFLAAATSGDVARLSTLLAADVTMVSDGGGKRPAALNPIVGRDKVLRFYAGIARKAGHVAWHDVRFAVIDGLPGAVLVDAQGGVQTTALAIEDGLIRAVYTVRNPDKLRHLTAAGAPLG